jgi:L-aspartate oxidase
VRSEPRTGDTAVVVVGAGIAGLATALRLAPMPVTLITGGALGDECATQLAQGGIAAAIGPDDAPEQHAVDTEVAAAGLGDGTIASSVAAAASESIAWLASHGVRFDRDGAGGLALGLEAAHSHPRILHAGGDRTGREVLRALVAAIRATPSIGVVEHATVDTLAQNHNGAVDGLLLRRGQTLTSCSARAVVLATGGLGGLFAHTTNPLTSVGSGLALGARAGAVLRDLEFVQFHPTAIDLGRDPMPLATEALRGAGARLVNAEGEDVMAGLPGGALAARDVVAASVFARYAQGQRVFLDLSKDLVRDLPRRFPGVSAICSAAGIELSRGRIPVRPAAHYHMGGLKVDARGRTSVEGLWACGEVASTGLHGGNRLASNSLLEAVVCANTIAEDLKGGSRLHLVRLDTQSNEGAVDARLAPTGGAHAALRWLMDHNVGVIRDDDGLSEVVRTLTPMVFGTNSTRRDVELAALLVALSALARRESRGAHRRADYPIAAAPRSQELTFAVARERALEVTGAKALLTKASSQ